MPKKLQDADIQVVENAQHVSLVTTPRTLAVKADDPPETWPTTLQVGSPKWKAYLLNAQTTPDLSIVAGEVVDFTATDWLVQWTGRLDRTTGEYREFSQLVFFNADGDTLATSSEVVPHQLARTLNVFGPEEWAAGITLRFRGRTSANGRGYHEMRVVPQKG